MATALTRVRGDTKTQKTTLYSSPKVAMDLTDAATIEFSFNKNNTVVTLPCVIDADKTSGIITFTFTALQVDTVGRFDADIQIVWVNGQNSTGLTTLVLKDDVNKT